MRSSSSSSPKLKAPVAAARPTPAIPAIGAIRLRKPASGFLGAQSSQYACLPGIFTPAPCAVLTASAYSALKLSILFRRAASLEGLINLSKKDLSGLSAPEPGPAPVTSGFIYCGLGSLHFYP